MSAEAKIREALAAGPTSGPWIGAGPSFGDPLPRYTTEIMTERDEAEECETVCSFPFLHHDAENEANAQLMAACNPAAMAELLAELDRLRAEMAGVREAWPRDLPTRVQVLYSPGDWDTFLYGLSGHLTMAELAEIDAALRDEDSESLFTQGPGDYLLSASRYAGQYGFEGRCEIQPGWELTVESFRPLDAARTHKEPDHG